MLWNSNLEPIFRIFSLPCLECSAALSALLRMKRASTVFGMALSWQTGQKYNGRYKGCKGGKAHASRLPLELRWWMAPISKLYTCTVSKCVASTQLLYIIDLHGKIGTASWHWRWEIATPFPLGCFIQRIQVGYEFEDFEAVVIFWGSSGSRSRRCSYPFEDLWSWSGIPASLQSRLVQPGPNRANSKREETQGKRENILEFARSF